MDAKTIFGICVVVIVLAMGGCFGNVGGGASTSSATASVPELVEGTKACYVDAQQQLSPQWANASTLDRAVAAFTVITTCEGSNQP